VFFLEVAEFQNLYNAFNRNKVPEEIAEPAAEKYYRWMRYAQETSLVVLDDIGTRSSTEGFRGDLHSIVNARVTNQLPTIYTSNILISDLETVFGEKRLADRVRDMTVILEFTGSSKRGKR
jgi:DNA replication protein DnaC